VEVIIEDENSDELTELALMDAVARRAVPFALRARNQACEYFQIVL